MVCQKYLNRMLIHLYFLQMSQEHIIEYVTNHHPVWMDALFSAVVVVTIRKR